MTIDELMAFMMLESTQLSVEKRGDCYVLQLDSYRGGELVRRGCYLPLNWSPEEMSNAVQGLTEIFTKEQHASTDETEAEPVPYSGNESCYHYDVDGSD